MIRTTGLTKDYGSRRAIENLTFEANQGEVVGFLGPNGAGKTTTMRILAGYMPPTFGTAQIAGFDVVEESLGSPPPSRIFTRNSTSLSRYDCIRLSKIHG